jgi:hypothetical protein
MGDLGNCGDIDYLHRQEPRTLQIYQTGIGLNERRDTGSNSWLKETSLDAETLQLLVANPPSRRIGAIDHQDVIAASDESSQDRPYRIEP